MVRILQRMQLGFLGPKSYETACRPNEASRFPKAAHPGHCGLLVGLHFCEGCRQSHDRDSTICRPGCHLSTSAVQPQARQRRMACLSHKTEILQNCTQNDWIVLQAEDVTADTHAPWQLKRLPRTVFTWNDDCLGRCCVMQ